jgi:hypothetical protein
MIVNRTVGGLPSPAITLSAGSTTAITKATNTATKTDNRMNVTFFMFLSPFGQSFEKDDFC